MDQERMDHQKFLINRELYYASINNNLPEIRRLVGVGADVSARGPLANTPLTVASERGHSQVVKELLDHGADTEMSIVNGLRALHCACDHGHLAVFKELLDHGADMEAKDNRGNTPLHLAATMDHLAVVKALVIAGANFLAANRDGRLPIHCAVVGRSSEVAKYLLQQMYATTRRLPLHELVEDLTWIGNPNRLVSAPLRYALHHEVLSTDDVVEIIEYLVERNPELLSSLDQDGSLPLHVACRRGAAFAFVQSLVNHDKASVKSATPQRDLPLFLACEMPETSLGTIFILMKLYPDLVYR
jgi:ankyrin repeat protein